MNFIKRLLKGRYELDLEKVALEAVKVKIQEIFDEIIVSTGMEGRDIVIRISLPDEIGSSRKVTQIYARGEDMESAKKLARDYNSNLDKEAQAAADELLGNNQE